MGRWVRWFGEGSTTTAAVIVPPRRETPDRVMHVSVAEATDFASGRRSIGKAAAPTGQMSVQQLSAEMLTALLVQEGVLTTTDEHASLQEHRATGRAVEEILVETGKLSETDLVSTISRRCKVPHLSLARTKINEDVVALVPVEFARANRIVPLQKLGKLLNVATTNPLDMGTFKKLEDICGLRVKPMLAMPSELRACLDEHYPPLPEELVAETQPEEEEVKITVKDFLKESWLGAVGPQDSSAGLPAITPEQEAAAAADGEGGEAAASPELEYAIQLSDDEVKAFKKASAAFLYKEWTSLIGLSGESAGDAIALSDLEFGFMASDKPIPKAAPSSSSKSSRSSAKTSRATRKKKRKKRRSSR